VVEVPPWQSMCWAWWKMAGTNSVRHLPLPLQRKVGLQSTGKELVIRTDTALTVKELEIHKLILNVLFFFFLLF
jgi:hypothetical protein